jgi:hypothetical protein
MNSSLLKGLRLTAHRSLRTLHPNLLRNFSDIKIKAPRPRNSLGENGQPIFKPDFKLDFDAQGRYLVYKANSQGVMMISIGLSLLAGFCVYQIVYKWESHYRVTNIFIVLGATAFTAMALMGLMRMSINVGRLYLRKSGTEIEVQKVVGWKKWRAEIKDLVDPETLSEQMSLNETREYFLLLPNQRLCFEIPNKLWIENGDVHRMNLNNPPARFKSEHELFEAILARREIDLDDQ